MSGINEHCVFSLLQRCCLTVHICIVTLDYIVEEDDGWRVLYRYADAVGLENCRTVYFYAPGAPVYKLPESFVGWYDCTQPLADTDLELPGWGMMNGEEGQGFAS